MTMIQKSLWSLLCVFSLLYLMINQATAAPKTTKTYALFIPVPPVQVSNYLKTGNGRQYVRPYLQVKTKKDVETTCRWMPRVRDAFFSALNSPQHETMAQEVVAKDNSVAATLTHAVQRAIPKNLVANVIAFDVHDLKSYREEKTLKGKTPCPNKKKKKSKKK